MDTRLVKAREIVKSTKLRGKQGVWLVPSQSYKTGGYVVKFAGGDWTCDCPHHTVRRVKCKHILAVAITVTQRETKTTRVEETAPDGTRRVTSVTTSTTKRVTYAQNWPAYNAAQVSEKAEFQRLLADLCAGLEEPAQRFGRPRLPLRDMLFCAAFKVFSTMSARRFQSDLRDAHAKGYIAKVPHFNSIFNTLERDDLAPLLQHLVTVTALPLTAVEQDFAVDSTGLTTTRFVRWFDAKYGEEMAKHEWVKLHLCCGVKTNIVTAVEVTEGYAADSPFLPLLVSNTANHFPLREVSADKGYSSRRNLECIARSGATPYIPFKSNATGGLGKMTLWKRLYHFYEFQRDAFLARYHQRSNVETTFHMIKAKFGDALRSKTRVAQMNEALLKVLCHNVCVVIQSMHELGITPDFAEPRAV